MEDASCGSRRSPRDADSAGIYCLSPQAEIGPAQHTPVGRLPPSAGISRGDRLGALQDDLVLHVLPFLPSREVVRSAVISRRWRHLWRSTPVVRVAGSDDRFRLFVNSLLLHRDTTLPLRSFEIDADLTTARGKAVDPHVEQWITHAVSSCRARSLTARFLDEDTMWSPRHRRPFASPHLTTMHLHCVKLAEGLLDFSCCPALLHLRLTDCRSMLQGYVP
ncbi:F-box/FBD/LRR-repeat protein At5g22700-like [Lolium perenne]|uniref:F-box/FBD/LRR-repeat protein At5g22700-like n=1 Tax=Lolium perenne TaxID=4522 RepID=UPI0021F68E96|nr:F-box/FBD/LRR-repeat protein At5g22700-like [Lolium perenne]